MAKGVFWSASDSSQLGHGVYIAGYWAVRCHYVLDVELR
jgi:hypothetical protein